MQTEAGTGQRKGVSKVKLAIGAASLFLFIVGMKRTFRMDEAAEADTAPEDEAEPRGR